MKILEFYAHLIVYKLRSEHGNHGESACELLNIMLVPTGIDWEIMGAAKEKASVRVLASLLVPAIMF